MISKSSFQEIMTGRIVTSTTIMAILGVFLIAKPVAAGVPGESMVATAQLAGDFTAVRPNVNFIGTILSTSPDVSNLTEELAAWRSSLITLVQAVLGLYVVYHLMATVTGDRAANMKRLGVVVIVIISLEFFDSIFGGLVA